LPGDYSSQSVLEGFQALTDRDRGPQHPDARLRKVVAFDFGSNLETRDPFTKQKIKKNAKGFLVENAVRFFENGLIRYPGSDEELTNQLQSYTVDRVSDSGRCVYKAGEKGDHTLDALMLSLVAYALEMSAIGKPKFNSDISFAPPIGSQMPDENPLETVQTPDGRVIQQQRLYSQPDLPSTRPDMNRSGDFEKQESLLSKNPGVPASNTNIAGKPKLWSWDGFLRDEPPPTNRLSRNKESGIMRRGATKKPNRRNI
jgi:hypothetical protein